MTIHYSPLEEDLIKWATEEMNVAAPTDAYKPSDFERGFAGAMQKLIKKLESITSSEPPKESQRDMVLPMINVEREIPSSRRSVLGWDGKYYYMCRYVGYHQEIVDYEDEEPYPDNIESDEKNGCFWLTPGFWETIEQHSGMYDVISVKRNITHWMPLPKNPVETVYPSPQPEPSLNKEDANANIVQTEQVCLVHHRRYFGQCPLCPSPIVTTVSSTYSGPIEFIIPLSNSCPDPADCKARGCEIARSRHRRSLFSPMPNLWKVKCFPLWTKPLNVWLSHPQQHWKEIKC